MEYTKLRNVMRYLFLLSTAFLIVVIASQWLTIMSLRSDLEEKIYVTVGGDIYSAIPDENETAITKDMYMNHSKLFIHNMFSHDLYNFEQRTKWAEYLVAKKDYNFIMAGFINSDQNIYKMYEKYDARTYYMMDSIFIDQSKDNLVTIYGKQKAVFGFGQESSTPLNCQFFVAKIDRSENNPYGLQIRDFNYIK